MRLSALLNLRPFILLLKRNGPVMTEADRALAAESSRRFLIGFGYLAKSAVDTGKMGFKCRPKMHGLDQMSGSLDRSAENPSYHMCWMEEDHLGELAKVMKKTNSRCVMVRAMQRGQIHLTELWTDMIGRGATSGNQSI